MRKLSAFMFGGIAAAAIAGGRSRGRQARKPTSSRSPFPMARWRNVEYVGDIAPKVIDRAAASRFRVRPRGDGFPILCGIRPDDCADAAPVGRDDARGAEAGPAAGAMQRPTSRPTATCRQGEASTTVVSVSNNGVTCTRTTRSSRKGRARPPKVTSSASGQCDGRGFAIHRARLTPPELRGNPPGRDRGPEFECIRVVSSSDANLSAAQKKSIAAPEARTIIAGEHFSVPRRVKDFIDISEYTSLDDLIRYLKTIRDNMPPDHQAELKIRGDDVFGRRLTISYFREQTAGRSRDRIQICAPAMPTARASSSCVGSSTMFRSSSARRRTASREALSAVAHSNGLSSAADLGDLLSSISKRSSLP